MKNKQKERNNEFKISLQNLKIVYSNWRYILTTLIISLFFYSLNVLIINYKSLNNSLIYGFFGWMKFIFNLLVGFHETIKPISFYTIITISLLFGILFSLIIFKTKFTNKKNNKKQNLITTIGVFLGILTPGCAACGIGFFSFLGLSSAFLSFFPYHGIELSFLAIFILIYSIYNLSKNLTSCNFIIKK